MPKMSEPYTRLSIARLGLGLFMPPDDETEAWSLLCALVDMWEKALRDRGFLESTWTSTRVFCRLRDISIMFPLDVGFWYWEEWRDAALAGGLEAMLVAYRCGVPLVDVLA